MLSSVFSVMTSVISEAILGNRATQEPVDSIVCIFVTGCSSSIGSVAALYASGPEIDPRVRYILSWKIPLPLIQEEQCISYWRKNGH